MPEKGLSVATYAAGASLATIALVYVFAPTYFLDSAPPAASNPLASLTGRKTGVVGLVNAANDCFINSVLQALAGLSDLRIYLIRETHRRKLDDTGLYINAVPEDEPIAGVDGAATSRRQMPVWKIEGLQAGLVTKGLKDMIDKLNERPIYKKTISAVPFVRVLEVAFRQRISRQQQDAQEFLQVVAERLCDEYHAGRRARRHARRQASLAATAASSATAADAAAVASVTPLNSGIVDEKLASLAAANDGSSDVQLAAAPTSDSAAGGSNKVVPHAIEDDEDDEDEDGFPMEGKIESQIECLTCGFKPRPSEQTFCTLTLNVPQVSSTTLSACFDTMMKTEYIDDFKCEKCRLLHAKQVLEAELAKSTSEAFQAKTKDSIAKLQAAIDSDPEKPPEDVELPDVRYSPKRRIARHFRMVNFPKVLAIHLSRSIYDSSNMSQKNSAKVSFPETLPLGGLLHQRKYKLLGLVTHKGSHHSGHYESFRRQTVPPPYSTPNTFRVSSVYSPAPTPLATTPKIGSSEPVTSGLPTANGSPVSSTPDLPPAVSAPSPSMEPKSSIRNSRSSSLREEASQSTLPQAPTSAPRETETVPLEHESSSASGSGKSADAVAETSSIRSLTKSTLSKLTPSRSGSRHGSQNGSQNGSRPASKNGTKQVNGAAEGGAGKPPAANGTANSTKAAAATNGAGDAAAHVKRRKKPAHHRWWRISDEKVKDASTREVLGMQREVYLLFYELERDPYRG